MNKSLTYVGAGLLLVIVGLFGAREGDNRKLRVLLLGPSYMALSGGCSCGRGCGGGGGDGGAFSDAFYGTKYHEMADKISVTIHDKIINRLRDRFGDRYDNTLSVSTKCTDKSCVICNR